MRFLNVEEQKKKRYRPGFPQLLYYAASVVDSSILSPFSCSFFLSPRTFARYTPLYHFAPASAMMSIFPRNPAARTHNHMNGTIEMKDQTTPSRALVLIEASIPGGRASIEGTVVFKREELEETDRSDLLLNTELIMVIDKVLPKSIAKASMQATEAMLLGKIPTP